VENQLVKGYYVQICSRFIEQNYSPEQRAQIAAQLSPDLKRALPTIKIAEWYPLHFAVDQIRGVFNLYKNFEEGEAAMDRLGAYIGEQASTTFLKLLMKILTLNMMIKKWPDFWLKYHNFGRMLAAIEGPNHIVFHIEPGYDYMYRLGPAWIRVACEALGMKNIELKTNMPRGDIRIDVIRVDVTWKN
jgi:hypothetical protein